MGNMKVVVLQEPGGPEHLAYQDVPKPEISDPCYLFKLVGPLCR